ncbi:hypothetical protein AcV5_006814 [Taiwanofungus camphoratus]|nr:hypothetical protein AcV5_006814 [Antrodia cinnamomea]
MAGPDYLGTPLNDNEYTSLGGQDRNQPLPYNPRDDIATQIETSVQHSLENLDTSYLDSLLLHSPLETLSNTVTAWKTLIRLQDTGKAKLIGMSNTYDVELLKKLEAETGRRVQVVQNRWFEGNRWDKEVCGYCRENGIQYQSFWTLSGSPNLLAHPSLREIARTKGCTPAQALFRLAQLHGITPLSGTTNEKHMKQDVEAEEININEEAKDQIRISAALKDIEQLVWGA